MERAVALAPPTTVLMTDPSKVCQELPIMMLMGRSVKLEAGIAGTSAVAAGSVAVAANPGPLLDQGLHQDQGPLLYLDLGHLLDQGHLEEAETVTTSAQMVEVARSPMLDLPEQEGPRVPVSPIALVAAAAELQESARIATRLSTASASS